MYETAEQLHPNFDQYERHKDDTETWVAEVLNGSMRTKFEFGFDGHELYGKDGGVLGEVFDDAIEEAKIITKGNPQLLFELRRRITEQGEYEDMLAMAKGELLDDQGEQANVIVVISDFPPELMNATQDIGGYNADRQQTMMRVISRQESGDIGITTQSLDGSNREALESIYERLGVSPEEGELLGQRVAMRMPENWHGQLVNNLTDQYDDSLHEQYGGQWHAGIRQEQVKPMDTYEFACAQTDLIEWFAKEKLHNSETAEELRYKLAATATKRWNDYCMGKKNEPAPDNTIGYVEVQDHLMHEIMAATLQAQAEGRTFSGCGTSVGASGTYNELRKLGYGNLIDEDEDGPLTFECTEGHTNTRPYGGRIYSCLTDGCEGSVGC